MWADVTITVAHLLLYKTKCKRPLATVNIAVLVLSGAAEGWWVVETWCW